MLVRVKQRKFIFSSSITVIKYKALHRRVVLIKISIIYKILIMLMVMMTGQVFILFVECQALFSLCCLYCFIASSRPFCGVVVVLCRHFTDEETERG